MLGFKTSVFYFVALVAIFTSCNSGSGTPVQQESGDLHYGNLEEFWQSNPACNEYTNGAKAYVGDGYPYTCILHNNEWIWTKICERNGTVHIDGESWFEGENCSKMMYQCDDGFLSEYLGHSPSCGFDLSSNSTDYKYPNLSNVGSSSSSTYTPPTSISSSSSEVAHGFLFDERDGQIYKIAVIGAQIWMAEDLNYKPEDFGGIPCENDKSKKCYTWETAKEVCPADWHLPSEDEFEILVHTFGTRRVKNQYDNEIYFWGATPSTVCPSSHRTECAYCRGLFVKDFKFETWLYDCDEGSRLRVRCLRDSNLPTTPSTTFYIPSIDYGSLIDKRDGKVYKTITIGNQTWMAENLNYNYNTGTAKSFCYDDSVKNCTTYGRLYTWAAAMDSAAVYSANGKGCGIDGTCIPTYPVRGVCPEGWHLPVIEEFQTLFEATVGGGAFSGTMLKSTSGWLNLFDEENGNGYDAYGFSVLSAGSRSDEFSNFVDLGHNATFWSITADGKDAYFAFYHDKEFPLWDTHRKNYNDARSIRCLKDY